MRISAKQLHAGANDLALQQTGRIHKAPAAELNCLMVAPRGAHRNTRREP